MSDKSQISRRGFVAAGLTVAGATSAARADEQRDESSPQWAQPLAQDFSVVHKRQNPGTYVEGCGLIVLPDQSILAVVPVVPRGGVPKKGPTEINFVRSDDGGTTWKTISQLPFYSAVPFLHDGRLYCFLFSMGKKFRNDDVYLAASSDGGRTWTEPAKILNGHFWTCQTSMVVRDQRLYWAVDDLRQPDHSNHRSPRAIVGDLRGDLMDAASWRISNFVSFRGLPDAFLRDDYDPQSRRVWNMPDHWLESNIVEVGGRLRLIATVKSQWQTLSNICGICDVEDDGMDLTMKFRQFHPMSGGQLKFAITHDPQSRMFWATANFVVDGQESQDWWDKARGEKRYLGLGGNDRRFLMLMYSVDALNWFQAGCVARAESLSESFMYGTPVIDGDDMLVISRTSINAHDQHDADHATFHRVKNFRSLALNLWPTQ
ncbi:MAG: sialidase family protein [Planctomycetota bacterium]